jgi:hypothetical protein
VEEGIDEGMEEGMEEWASGWVRSYLFPSTIHKDRNAEGKEKQAQCDDYPHDNCRGANEQLQLPPG